MEDNFIEAFKRFSFLKVSDLVSLFKICSLKTFKKEETIAMAGEYCKYAFLIRKGIVRTYVLGPDGEEKTIRLAKEKDFTSCGMSFLHDKPSTEFLHAVEDCKVIAVNSKKLNELARENPRILRLSYEGIKEAFSEAIYRVEFFTTLTPEARYEAILKDSPDLILRVPQKYLASFIGVTKVSLSRIRNRKVAD
ncbi:MAG: Crp/Fnr family transcriptional regulator [Ekhidna sp.]|nr:Crp/Fnr family transcriptional regulator [Ekhidna sp.]